MNAAEVLKSVIEALGISPAELTNKCGFSKDRIYSILRGRTKTISADTIFTIIEHYPVISYSYMATGRGSMFNVGVVKVPSLPTDEVVTPAKRLEAISTWSGDNIAEIARKTGLSKGNLSSIMSGKWSVKNITPASAEKIQKAYPEVLSEFLRFGTGPMLKDGRYVSDIMKVFATLQTTGAEEVKEPERTPTQTPAINLEKKVESLQRQVEYLSHMVIELTNRLDNGAIAAEPVNPPHHEI